MNFKERWEKQNNSVKLLLRRLKRHDTFVVATAVVIALLMCGGLIYISTPVVAANARDQVVQKENENNEKTNEKLNELHDYLDDLDDLIVKNHEGLVSYYENTKKELAEGDDDSDAVSEKVSGLGTNLKDIHSSVSSTESRIENLKELIEKENGDSSEKVKKEFDAINSELDNITKEYENIKNHTKELMDELNDEIKSGDKQLSSDSISRYEDLLAKLSEFNSDLEKRNIDSVTELRNEFITLNTALGDKIDEKIEIVSTEMGTGMDGIKAYIDEKTTGINGKLDQVFQRVSNGKKILASALLTKGVEINEDATFTEFGRAIESISTQVVLDTGETAANIEYDYHYHVDGKGQTNGASMVSSALRGGCFTTPVYHKHSDRCYTTRNVYTITTKEDVELRHHVKDDSDGTPEFAYRCHHCGAEFIGNSARHHETVYSVDEVKRRKGRVEDIKTERILSCNKNASTIEGYAPACGYAHGQVVSAHIVFAGKNSKYNTTVPAIDTSRSLRTQSMAMPSPRNLINEDILLFEGFDFGDDEPEDESIEEASSSSSSSEASDNKVAAERETSNVTSETGDNAEAEKAPDEGAPDAEKTNEETVADTDNSDKDDQDAAVFESEETRTESDFEEHSDEG
ncbi:MAG: hypothetical protein J5802_10580 [Butyrivibrio sp.]|nr:hypothetical protein [Butyrivibrio sp.]